MVKLLAAGNAFFEVAGKTLVGLRLQLMVVEQQQSLLIQMSVQPSHETVFPET